MGRKPARSIIAVWLVAAGILTAASLLPACAWAQQESPVATPLSAVPTRPKAQSRLSEAQRIAILRQLIAVAGTARLPLPMDKHGVELSSDGQVLNGDQVSESLFQHGPADQVGERVVITGISFKSDRIIFEINGGPLQTHWWDHLSVGVNGAQNPLNQLQRRKTHGAAITLRFPHNLPALTSAELKADLNPLVDWEPARVASVMVQPLPPAVKSAIAHHHVLVGMNTAMLIATLGRTDRKIRQTDPGSGQTVENWIYGQPPAPTTFVRVTRDHVVDVTTWRADGSKTEDSTPDPALTQMAQANDARANGAAAASSGDAPPPTLRRPGDPAPGQGGPGIGTATPPSSGAPAPEFPAGADQPSPYPGGMPGPSNPTTFPGASPNPSLPGAMPMPPSSGPTPY